MFKTTQRKLGEFAQSQSAGGVALAFAALAALLLSNSPWRDAYQAFIDLPGEIRLGSTGLVLSKPLQVWVNDLWMAVFFFLVGLEIKREVLEGELSSARQAVLPIGAALGGMAVPALIFAAINRADAVALKGWAIPAATDIAFALAVLSLLGARVPASLKVFLTAVAIIDDLGAILVIAFFYASGLSWAFLGAAGMGVLALAALNRLRVASVGPYVLVGLVTWVCVLKSGIHPTLAGVATALAIPTADSKGGSPLKAAEHALHPWVAFLVLPVFAFANAGVSLQGASLATLAQTVPLGIAAGLVLGKLVGVFGASWLLIRLAGASLPANSSWTQLAGVSALCGVGFTMSLFIGTLAFQGLGQGYLTQVKIGVLGGSLLSALAGAAILFLCRPRRVNPGGD